MGSVTESVAGPVGSGERGASAGRCARHRSTSDPDLLAYRLLDVDSWQGCVNDEDPRVRHGTAPDSPNARLLVGA
jgi:hypothetical protein